MDTQTCLQVYRDLADWYERQGEAAMRDRFLVLAADAAFTSGQPQEAERLRQRLLHGNPHHMLKPFNSFNQALQSSTIQIYIHDLRTNYPAETAEKLLRSLHGSHDPEPTLPQTAPLIQFNDKETLPLGADIEPLKVYSLREEPEPTLKSEPPVAPTSLNRAVPPTQPVPFRPTPTKPSAGRPNPNLPAPRAQPILPQSPASPWPASPKPTDPALAAPVAEPTAATGAWLTLMLLGMTVTAGCALAVYTLARPFLPPQWLL
jgi:hypothetical protein